MVERQSGRLRNSEARDFSRVRVHEWLKTLKDKSGIVSILRVIKRAEKGNFGEHRFCRDGVWELVIDTGPGYRVYYSMTGKTIILLLCAGSKRTQQKDINRAIEFLKRYKEEHE